MGGGVGAYKGAWKILLVVERASPFPYADVEPLPDGRFFISCSRRDDKRVFADLSGWRH